MAHNINLAISMNVGCGALNFVWLRVRVPKRFDSSSDGDG